MEQKIMEVMRRMQDILSEEQLREEIEIQKRFYYLQKEEDKENKDL